MRASGLGWSGLAVVLGATASKCQEEPPTFDWTTITPSEDLEWTECYGGVFQCARLEVPYNYENETDTRKMAVALQMLPAVVDIDDPTHGGSIFINPGGPGHPGTDFVMNTGQHLQLTFDIPGEKHYDIIGWDPRGVGNTTPRIQCLDGLFDRDSFYTEHRGTHAYQPNSDNIAYLLASYEGLAAKCKWQHDNNGVDVFEYVSTALVIEDMVRMVDKLEAQRNDAKRKRGLTVRRTDGPARLQYYGVSYGSVIGQFFASMHPERVGRIAIDGIVDVDDFLAERGWVTGTQDTDLIYEEFLEGCFNAKDGCALYQESDASPEDIGTRVWDWMEAMDKKPKGLVTAEGKRTIIHGQDLSTLFGALGYGPIGGFQVLAAVAAASIAGVYDPLTSVQESFRDIPNWEDGCPASDVPALIAPPPDFITSVLCAEAEPVNDKDVDWWVDYAQEQEEISQIYGHAIVHIKLGCSSFPFRAVYTFNGPFTHPEHDPDVVEGKPAAPILFLNNRVDPITPVKCARDMAAKYPGSGLVVQDSLGHGALISAPSNCTDQIVRKYFDTGVVPEEETFCEQECGPWDAGCSPVKTPQSTGAEKRGVLPVPRSFTRRVPFPPRFLY